MNRNIFDTVKLPGIGSNTFNLSHGHNTTVEIGRLVPVLVLESIPGDFWNISPELLARFAPLVAPAYEMFTITLDGFFCPNRIVWSGWDDFITGKSTALVPFIVGLSNQSAPGNLGHYMGLPNIQDDDIDVSAIPFAAYYRIYNEWYRDENLQEDELFPLIVSGNNPSFVAAVSDPPPYRAWAPDYFTKALPFAQKGPDVSIPLTDNQPSLVEVVDSPINPAIIRNAPGGAVSGSGTLVSDLGDFAIGTNPKFLDPNGTLKVDIQAQAATIETLRSAFRLQEFLERDARGGTRLTETLYVHFGVKSSDARLDRPEFMGRRIFNVRISEVLSTANTTNPDTMQTTPVGSMAGHGIAAGGSKGWRYFTEEHGYVFINLSIMPKASYLDGLHKHFQRRTRLDYAFPTFAHLGEQEVKVGELYSTGTNIQAQQLFGYVPRYAEYKYMPSRASGAFGSGGTLLYWHQGRTFETPPALNSDFIICNPDPRIFAVAADPWEQVLLQMYFKIYVSRKLPVFGIPSI